MRLLRLEKIEARNDKDMSRKIIIVDFGSSNNLLTNGKREKISYLNN